MSTSDNGEQKRIFASQSFVPEEIDWLEQVLFTIVRGGDPKVLARSPLLGKWLKKVETMKRRCEQVRRENGE